MRKLIGMIAAGCMIFSGITALADNSLDLAGSGMENKTGVEAEVQADIPKTADEEGSEETKAETEAELTALDASGKNPNIYYSTHVQNIGWIENTSNGLFSGSVGSSLRMEAVRIYLDNTELDGGVQYQAHVQNIGWQDWASNGEMAGTEGRAYRVEGIRIELTGEIAEYYQISYRTHVQNIGWQDWVLDGKMAGTEGQSLRLEGIEIKLVPRKQVRTSDILFDSSKYLVTSVQTDNGWNCSIYDNRGVLSAEFKNMKAIEAKTSAAVFEQEEDIPFILEDMQGNQGLYLMSEKRWILKTAGQQIQAYENGLFLISGGQGTMVMNKNGIIGHCLTGTEEFVNTVIDDEYFWIKNAQDGKWINFVYRHNGQFIKTVEGEASLFESESGERCIVRNGTDYAVYEANGRKAFDMGAFFSANNINPSDHIQVLTETDDGQWIVQIWEESKEGKKEDVRCYVCDENGKIASELDTGYYVGFYKEYGAYVDQAAIYVRNLLTGEEFPVRYNTVPNHDAIRTMPSGIEFCRTDSGLWTFYVKVGKGTITVFSTDTTILACMGTESKAFDRNGRFWEVGQNSLGQIYDVESDQVLYRLQSGEEKVLFAGERYFLLEKSGIIQAIDYNGSVIVTI